MTPNTKLHTWTRGLRVLIVLAWAAMSLLPAAPLPIAYAGPEKLALSPSASLGINSVEGHAEAVSTPTGNDDLSLLPRQLDNCCEDIPGKRIAAVGVGLDSKTSETINLSSLPPGRRWWTPGCTGTATPVAWTAATPTSPSTACR